MLRRIGQLGRVADASEHPPRRPAPTAKRVAVPQRPPDALLRRPGPGAAVSQPKVERTRTNDGPSAGVFCVRGSRPFGALRDRDAAEPSNAAMIRSAPRQRLARRRFCGTCSVWCFASVAWLSVAPVGIERVDPSVALRLAGMATVIDAAAVEAMRAEGQPTFPVLHAVDEQGHPVPIQHGALPSMHSFRHTVASRALLAGESVDEIAFLLGHRDANVTRGRLCARAG